MDLSSLGSSDTAANLEKYVQSFSADAREIFEHFKFTEFVRLLDDANLLYLVVQRFAAWDLSPKAIDNHHMGLAFEELIRKFAESSNETAGEHFTPRDIVRLTTALVFIEDDALLTLAGIVRSIYDPTGGTGGMISSGMEGGSRIGIILNGSPLFTGGAGSGESEIRRYLLENDLVEAIVALPTDMFYNTGIATYIWILSNNKPAHRKGTVQLIHAADCSEKMRKSLGSMKSLLTATSTPTARRASSKPSTPNSRKSPARSKPCSWR